MAGYPGAVFPLGIEKEVEWRGASVACEEYLHCIEACRFTAEKHKRDYFSPIQKFKCNVFMILDIIMKVPGCSLTTQLRVNFNNVIVFTTDMYISSHRILMR